MRIFFHVSIVGVVLLWGCDLANTPSTPTRNNPTDPSSPTFQSPNAVISKGITSGEILANHSTTIEWTGNLSDDQMLYSFRMDSSNWSLFSVGKSASYELLDEGQHLFTVKARYLNQVEQPTPTTVPFSVDAVKGPAVLCTPRKTSIIKNNTFDVEIGLEEVNEVAGVKIMIQYDKTKFSLEAVPEVYKDSKSILLKNGGSVIDIVDINSVTGTITFNLAVAGGNPAFVSGSGKLGKLRFRALANSGTRQQITVGTESLLRKSDNTVIQIQATVNAIVDIQ